MNYEDMRKALIEDSEKEIAEQLWQVEKIIKQLTNENLLKVGELYTKEVERRLENENTTKRI